MLKNSRAWKRKTRKKSGADLRRAESPGGEGELTHDWQSTIPQRKTKTNRCRGTESLTKRRRNSVDVEEGHRGGGLRSSRECDPEEHVPQDRDQANREDQERKRVQRTRRREDP